MKNISVKIGLIYILFTVFNISFFTVSIYIEQNELIIKNRELNTLLRTEKIYLPLKYLVIDSPDQHIQSISQDILVKKIVGVLKDVTQDDYLLFTEKGKILYKSREALTINAGNRTDAVSAIANKEFLGQPYLLKTYNTDEAYSYIPIGRISSQDIVILFKYKMENLNDYLMKLYRVVFTVIVLVLVLQIFFGIVFYTMVIRPLKVLNKKSLEIKEGKLSSRVKLKRRDEIGQLGRSFNEMAASIEEKIRQLKEKNRIMEFELNTAGKVQAGIYPKPVKSDLFDVAVYHRPLGKVSGDYHDIFRVNKHKYGFLIVDVSGHGVPAALTTMRIQNTFKRLVSEYEDTGKLFAGINTELLDLMENFSCYFTAFYFSLDTNRKIIYTNGGHPNVYLLKPHMKSLFELQTEGFALGVTKDANPKFKSRERKIDPGDKIILFSDGITEARNEKGEPYTTKKLLRAILHNANLPCEVMRKNIIEDLTAFRGKARRKDDETLMIVEIKTGGRKKTIRAKKRGLLNKITAM